MLAVILIAALAVRAYKFGSVPWGLNQDEASTAYDAFSMLWYAMDRNGIHNPAVLISWGSGMNALPAYLQMPFIALFGLNVVSARLPHLLLGMASIVLAFLLMKKITGDRWTGVLAAFVMAVSPWHIMLSRWSVDENIFPGVFLAGITALAYSDERPRLLPLAYALFGLSMYAHGASYFVAPVYVALLTPYIALHRKASWRMLAASLAIFTALALPHGLYLLINEYGWNSIVTPFITIPKLTGFARYKAVASVFSPDWLALTWVHARELVTFLRIQHDAGLGNAMPEFGILYRFGMPIALAGSVMLLVRSANLRRFRPQWCVALWLGVSVALGLIVTPDSVNRMNTLIIPLMLGSALFLRWICRSRHLIVAMSALYIVAFAQFTSVYFNEYPRRAESYFFASLIEAVQTASDATDGNVCVQAGDVSYVHVLFAQQYDPRWFITTAKIANPGAQFQYVRSFDRYAFTQADCERMHASAYIAGRGEADKYRTPEYEVFLLPRYVVAVRKNRMHEGFVPPVVEQVASR